MAANPKKITVSTIVNADIRKVWKYWNEPEHITRWNNASDDWHTPKADNDLRDGGTFSYQMAAKDGSFSFDFAGSYDHVKPQELIAYTLGDGRKVEINFTSKGNQTEITETFEAETENPEDLQKAGWQAILDNFKKHVEAN